MKSFFHLVAIVSLTAASLDAAQHVVTTSGFTFSPPTLTISQGDTVIFSISGIHDAVEVAESTWNVNGDQPLPGGFAVPFGGGSVVLVDTGTRYYICEAHILSGMKGRIIVTVPPPPPNTITIASLADQDGLAGTAADRVAKRWSLKLYQDSVGSGIVIDSVASGSTLTVAGLAAGTYVAAQADSVSWTHLTMVVDGVPQGPTSAATMTFTVVSGEARSVTFVNSAPNMIISSGLTFDPDTLTVDAGDTVFFVVPPDHVPREVSKATWLANGSTSNGGFDLSSGGGTYVADAGGVDYYVCVPHAAGGMKGVIMVNPIPPSTITLRAFGDQDGDHATAADRVPKRWSLALYKDSVGSGVIVDSVGAGYSLVVTGLPPGVYAAAEADSAPWSHISMVLDGAAQGPTALASTVFSVGSAEARTVDFINTIPNMIISDGFTFLPETLTVDSGTTVRFVLDSIHTARRVDSLAWAANDTTPNGGFDLPAGGGAVTMDQPGDNFYVCVPHASGGMKGIIRVTVDPYAGAFTDTVVDGWNLLSLPFAITDSAVQDLYPGAATPAYVYEAGYSARATVSNGPGYWIKFNGAQTVDLEGPLVPADTIPVAQGWNIVGSVSFPLAASAVGSVPPGLVTSSFFGYDGGYFTADTVRPGQAYWVKASAAGSIILAPGSVAGPSIHGTNSRDMK